MGITIRRLGDHVFELDMRMQKIVSIKLDQRLLEHIDEMWRKAGYRSRSDFIREAIKAYMEMLQTRNTMEGKTVR